MCVGWEAWGAHVIKSSILEEPLAGDKSQRRAITSQQRIIKVRLGQKDAGDGGGGSTFVPDIDIRGRRSEACDGLSTGR